LSTERWAGCIPYDAPKETYFHRLSGAQTMKKLSSNPSKLSSSLAKLKLMLFVVVAFSFGIGTAQAGHCPDASIYFFSDLKKVSIEAGNPETGDVVSCYYGRAGNDSVEWNIKSSDPKYNKGYVTVMPDVSDLWPTIENKRVCSAVNGNASCHFTATNADDQVITIFPKKLEPNSQQASLNNTDTVPPEYSCRPELYQTILQTYDQCIKGLSLTDPWDMLTFQNCGRAKNEELATLAAICGRLK
jgi:hypothetical protein